MRDDFEIHEHARMPAEALRQKRPRDLASFVRQQLRLDAMDARRLLQRLNDVGEKPFLNFEAIKRATSIANKQVADHSLALLVNKKRIAENTAALDGSITGKNLRLHIAENHLGRLTVIPRQQASPRRDLFFEKRPEVGRGEVAKV